MDEEGGRVGKRKKRDEFPKKCHFNLPSLSLQGDVDAMECVGFKLPESDPDRWWMFLKAASYGNDYGLLCCFGREVWKFESGIGNATVVFLIGRVIREHAGSESDDETTHFAEAAFAFYQAQLKACRLAVDYWTLVGIRFNVVKDIRKLIARLIWDSREEARYVVERDKTDGS
jgi:hypothetical protein